MVFSELNSPKLYFYTKPPDAEVLLCAGVDGWGGGLLRCFEYKVVRSDNRLFKPCGSILQCNVVGSLDWFVVETAFDVSLKLILIVSFTCVNIYD